MYMSYTVTEHGDLVPLTMIHGDCSIGVGTIIHAFTTIEANVTIGVNCVIGSNVFVGTGTVIEDKTRIQHGAFICRNAKIGKGVFIGPLAVLTDDKYPKVSYRTYLENVTDGYNAQPPTLKDGCSIGAGAIILPGVVIGENALVGAGAVVSKDVPNSHVVVGVPAAERLEWKSAPREGFGID